MYRAAASTISRQISSRTTPNTLRRIVFPLLATATNSNVSQIFVNAAATTTTTRNASSETSPCPYDTLGVTSSCSYATVKRNFLKLALALHPDRSTTSSCSEKFIVIRKAFERIEERSDGGTNLVDDGDDSSFFADGDKDGGEFDEWFRSETGRCVSDFGLTLSKETRMEVKAMRETHVPGGLDRGGMWSLADAIARDGDSGLFGAVAPAIGAGNRRRKKR